MVSGGDIGFFGGLQAAPGPVPVTEAAVTGPAPRVQSGS